MILPHIKSNSEKFDLVFRISRAHDISKMIPTGEKNTHTQTHILCLELAWNIIRNMINKEQ